MRFDAAPTLLLSVVNVCRNFKMQAVKKELHSRHITQLRTTELAQVRVAGNMVDDMAGGAVVSMLGIKVCVCMYRHVYGWM